MKNKMLAIGGLSLALIFSACSSSSSSSELENILDKIETSEKPQRTNFEVIGVNDQYSLDVPDFMTTTTALNNDASLQYNDRFKEKYVIVIDESKEEFIEVFKNIGQYDESKSVIENYAEAQAGFIGEGADVIDESDIDYMKINGMAGAKKSLDANVAGVPEPISYYLGFAEGKESLYMVMAWTLKSRKDDFTGEAAKMIRSLKEL
jgi:hypothetical protein